MAQGMWMRLPKGVSTQTRQSPSSSRQRSMTMLRSSETWPVAACLVGEEAHEVFGGAGVEVVFGDEAGEGGGGRQGLKFAHHGADAAAEFERDGRGLRLSRRAFCRVRRARGETRTRSWVISSMRQVVAPRMKVSPGRDSKTISSSSSPTRTDLPSLPERKTP